MSDNPYQTPSGQLSNDNDLAFGEVSFFNPSGRINRLRYWAHGMSMALLFYAIMAVGFVFISVLGVAFIGWTIIVIAYISLLVYSFILVIQRLHDLNKTGWMSLLMLVPFANIYLFVIVIFFKGTAGRNNYGLQTPPNKTWHWIMAFSFPVLIFVIGILAAVSIPAYQKYVERAQAPQFEQDNSYSGESDTSYSEDSTESEIYEESSSDDMDYKSDTEEYEDSTAEDSSPDETTSEEQLIEDTAQ